METKSAKEMFEELGYKCKHKSETQLKEEVLDYYTGNYLAPTKLYRFHITCKYFSTTYGLDIFRPEDIKAINQQCKELGWIDDQVPRTIKQNR